MTTQTLIETDYATLRYYPETGIVHSEFHKYVYGLQFRNFITAGLTVFQQNRLNKWLSDDRKTSTLPQADLDWAQEHWIVPMINSGWKYWAIVLPEKLVARQPILRAMEEFAKYGLQVGTFDDPASALAWLESVDR